MSEKYKIELKNGTMHLFKNSVMFNEDCGKLYRTFTGKLETRNIFGNNYVLQDISGIFFSGKKYKVKKSNGETGIMIKGLMSNWYNYNSL